MKILNYIIAGFFSISIFSCNNNSSTSEHKSDTSIVVQTPETDLPTDTNTNNEPTGNVGDTIKKPSENTNTANDVFLVKGIPVENLLKQNYELKAEIKTFKMPVPVHFDGSPMQVTSPTLKNLIVEERIETSITVMNEGPHCDLTHWKHYNSPFLNIPLASDGKFKTIVYETEEKVNFPSVTVGEVKAAVNKHCSKEFQNVVKNITKPLDYPIGVGVSNYFLKFSGEDEAGNVVAKTIVFSLSLGD